MGTPPGVSAENFAAAIKEFEQAVGKEWVFTSAEDVALYRDAYSPFWGEPDERVASAAVAPTTVEEVQAIVRTANKYKIPIYPISTGRNLGYGGSAPVLSGSVVVDLKRMNRILEVNERNAYALVEPGVSYFDLYRYIRDKKLKLWIDCPDPGWGSPVGNALDRGGGYTRAQYRDHFSAHCGMEVVLPTGELLRTGMGAMPTAKTWQQYKSGFGPWIDGIFSQSNFGIVTKMGFWLMPQPQAYFDATVTVPEYRDIIPLLDVLNELETGGINDGWSTIVSPLKSNYVGTQDPELVALLQKAYGDNTPELDAYAKRKGIPYWSCTMRFYGPPKVIAARWEHAKERYASIPGAKFEDGKSYTFPLSDEQITEIQETTDPAPFGIPSLQIFSIGARSASNPYPTHGHMWFSPIVPRTGEAVIEAYKGFSEAVRDLGLPVTTTSPPFVIWERSLVFINFFPVTEDIEANKKNRAAFRELVKRGREHGWGEYRTAVAFYDDVMATYDFNDHALLRFHETVKDAVDPNGIISAGRFGIWPKHLRKT